LIVSCSISHVYVALEVAHEKAVLLFERILPHDQMLVVGVYQTGRKPHKLLRSITTIDFPSVRVYGYNFLYQFLSGNAHQRAEDEVTDASTHYVQLQSDLLQLMQQLQHVRAVHQLRIRQNLCSVITGHPVFLEKTTLDVI